MNPAEHNRRAAERRVLQAADRLATDAKWAERRKADRRAAAPSLKDLAELAMPMAWEEKAPIGARQDFRDAMTPDLFLEMLTALEAVVKVADRATVEFDLARAAIAKATGAAS
jgi:hypothetical protein